VTPVGFPFGLFASHALFQRQNKPKLTALSLTPAAMDLSGDWTVEFSMDGQPLLGLARLEQTGLSYDLDTPNGTILSHRWIRHPTHEP